MKTKHTHKRFFMLYGEDKNLLTLTKSKQRKNHKIQYRKYVYLLHQIIYKMTIDEDRYERDGKTFHIKNMRKELGWREDVTGELLRDLMRWGYIVYFKFPVKGIKATGYKLAPAYENSLITIQYFKRTEAKFLRRLIEQERKQKLPEIHGRLHHIYENHVRISEEGLEYLELRYPFEATRKLTALYRARKDKADVIGALNELLAQIPIPRPDLPLFSLLTEDHYINQSKVCKRLFNTFCNLKREHRKYILLGGKEHSNTDIVNSQVTLSIPLIREAICDPASEDFLRYQHLATSGKFYEFLAEAMGVDISNDDERGKFKKEFFGAVFFSKPSTKKSKMKDAFEKHFPTVHEAINKIKSGNYKRFSIELQRLEADIMISDALNTLQEEGHMALPLHDAIYVNNEASLLRAKEIIRESCLAKYGLKIAFKDELHVPTFSTLLHPNQSHRCE